MFINFIKDKKIISEHSLLDSLCKLYESQPSLLRIMIDEKVLKEEEMFKIIDIQIKEEISLLEAVKKSVLLDDKKIKELLLLKNDRGLNFSNILLEEHLANPDDFKKLVQEYKDKFENEGNTESDGSPSVNQAALDSLKELGITDEAVVGQLEKKANEGSGDKNLFEEEFVNLLNDQTFGKINKVKDFIIGAIETEGSVNTYINSLYRDFHVIKGGACLAEIKEIEKLLDRWEMTLEGLFKKDEGDIRNWFHNGVPFLDKTVSVLKQIKSNHGNNIQLLSECEGVINEVDTFLAS